VSNQYDDTMMYQAIPSFYIKNNGYGFSTLELGPDAKFSIFSSVGLIFRSYGTVPRRAYVSSASIDFEVVANPVPAGVSPSVWIVPLNKDGRWDPAAGRTDWTNSPTVDFGARMLNAALGDIGTSWMTPTSQDEWSFRFASPDQSERIAQSIKCTSSTNLAHFDVRIRKQGSPTGNVWIEVWTDAGDGVPGSLLATSNTINVATVTTSGVCDPATRFTFGTPLAVTSGTNYVFVINGSWTPGANHVQWSQKIAANPYADGRSTTYGRGRGWEYQNWMSNKDWYDNIPYGSLYIRGAFWQPPLQGIGQIATTADISAGLRSYFASPGYTPGDPIAIALLEFFLGSPNGKHYYAASTHPTAAAPKLTFEWHPPAVPQSHLDRRC
jgi:hypothetical protein